MMRFIKWIVIIGALVAFAVSFAFVSRRPAVIPCSATGLSSETELSRC
jgi:hypothetical protein